MILSLSAVLAGTGLSANEFGFKLGYMDVQQSRFDSDWEQRFAADELYAGAGGSVSPGNFYGPYRSDTSFLYPAQIYFTPGDWPGGLRLEFEYWSSESSSIDGEGISQNGVSLTSFDHHRSEASAMVAAFLIREGEKGGSFDLILRAGGIMDYQFYSEQTYRFFTGGYSIANYIGQRETRFFVPALGLETRIPIANGLSFFAGFQASAKRNDQLDFIQIEYAPSSGFATATADRTVIDVGILKNRYEAGLAYNVTEDFLLRFSYRIYENRISYSGYAGVAGTFGGTPSNPQFTLNQAEMLTDAALVYSGTKRETIEGFYFGIEKFFTW